MTTALMIISLVLSVAGYTVSEVTAGMGNDIKSRLTKVANAIYSKIGKNNTLLEKMYNAYNSKNSDLANSILMSAGFGPMVTALRKEMAKNKKEYNDEKERIDKENIELNNKYNQATNASAQAGSSFAGNAGARSVASQLEQYVEGGLTNNETSTNTNQG